eukprot:762564-Hanusia_phi.AAC.4
METKISSCSLSSSRSPATKLLQLSKKDSGPYSHPETANLSTVHGRTSCSMSGRKRISRSHRGATSMSPSLGWYKRKTPPCSSCHSSALRELGGRRVHQVTGVEVVDARQLSSGVGCADIRMPHVAGALCVPGQLEGGLLAREGLGQCTDQGISRPDDGLGHVLRMASRSQRARQGAGAVTSNWPMLSSSFSSLLSLDAFLSISELNQMMSSPRALASVHAVASLPIPALLIQPAPKIACAADRAP